MCPMHLLLAIQPSFTHRDVEYSFMSLGVCSDPAEAEKCARWAREF